MTGVSNNIDVCGIAEYHATPLHSPAIKQQRESKGCIARGVLILQRGHCIIAQC